MRPASLKTIEADLAALERMDIAALKARWVELFGVPAPKRMKSDFFRRALAHRLQERAYGGLRRSTRRRLRQIAAALTEGRAVETRPKPALRPGTRLMREWAGTTHIVEVTADGFLWSGSRYRSLSAVASAITESRWSGPRFFGLQAEAGR